MHASQDIESKIYIVDDIVVDNACICLGNCTANAKKGVVLLYSCDICTYCTTTVEKYACACLTLHSLCTSQVVGLHQSEKNTASCKGFSLSKGK